FATRPAAATPCSAVSQPFDAMWSVPVRETIHAAFVGAAGEFAQATWSRVAPAIDAWGRDWVDLRRHTCEATHVRGEQSAELMDRRMACLEDRRHELAAVLASFATADRDVVIGSLRTLRGLEPLARCSDTTALLGAPVPPFGKAAAIEAGKREVDAIAAITHAKKTADTVERAQRAVKLATQLGYAPLEAEALFQLGEAQINAQKWEPASTSLEAAALAADRARDDRLRAKAWIEDVYVVASGLQRGNDALRTGELARAALARVPDPGALPIHLAQYTEIAYEALGKNDEALRYGNQSVALIEPTTDRISRANAYDSRALVYTNLHRYDDALADHRKALELDIAEYGPDHPVVAGVMSNIANALMMHVGYAEADTLLHRALAIGEKSLGPEHPQVATYLNNLVNLYRRQEKWTEALPYARRAVAIREKTLPPNHPMTARAVMNLATILAAMGNPQEAEGMFERGLAMQVKSLPAVHGDVAYARQLHATNLRELGRIADARDEYARSLAIYSALGHDEPSAAETAGMFARAEVDAGDPRKGLVDADQALARALKADNEVSEAECRWARADALSRLDRTAEAKAEIATVLAALGKHPEADDVLLATKIEAWAKAQLR
ncbi:MAG TPA: tetratricopeptide repeat protein, partial [Kofleriaceae bacterium]|nr:tetratricopeptide repeat protein [Kofleriaceae bacterium]